MTYMTTDSMIKPRSVANRPVNRSKLTGARPYTVHKHGPPMKCLIVYLIGLERVKHATAVVASEALLLGTAVGVVWVGQTLGMLVTVRQVVGLVRVNGPIRGVLMLVGVTVGEAR